MAGAGSRFMEGRKTRPYNFKSWPSGFNYMKPNNQEKATWGNDNDYNRRSMFKYLYGGVPLDVKNYNYTRHNWNSPIMPLDLSERLPEYSSNYLKRFYQKAGLSSLKTNDTFLQAMSANLEFSHKDSYGSDLFTTIPEQTIGLSTHQYYGRLLNDLRAVTKMIRLARNEGYRRQIYLLKFNGFDTHSDQLVQHPSMLRELSLCLYKFSYAIEEMGLSYQVVTYKT